MYPWFLLLVYGVLYVIPEIHGHFPIKGKPLSLRLPLVTERQPQKVTTEGHSCSSWQCLMTCRDRKEDRHTHVVLAPTCLILHMLGKMWSLNPWWNCTLSLGHHEIWGGGVLNSASYHKPCLEWKIWGKTLMVLTPSHVWEACSTKSTPNGTSLETMPFRSLQEAKQPV